MTIDEMKKCGSLSECARQLYGNDNYSSREKIKKILLENNIVWQDFFKKEIKYCLNCGKIITGRQQKFCSSSCAATFNNKLRVKNTDTCLMCGKPLTRKRAIFCSQDCANNYKYEKNVEKWLNGDDTGYTGKGISIKSFVRRYLLETRGCACEKCQWSEQNPITKSVPLQIHHIDGNCANNMPENLQLLCPNCHSLTETFGRLNKESKRIR